MDGNSYFDVTIQAKFKIRPPSLPMPGKHNISNALAAIDACHLEVGISYETLSNSR